MQCCYCCKNKDTCSNKSDLIRKAYYMLHLLHSPCGLCVNAATILYVDLTWLWHHLCLWWRSAAARWAPGLRPSTSSARSPPGGSTSRRRAAPSVGDVKRSERHRDWPRKLRDFFQVPSYIHFTLNQTGDDTKCSHLNVILRQKHQRHSARKHWTWFT